MNNKTSDENVGSIEEDINELKTLLFQDRLTNYGKRKMINYYENEITRQKQINEEHQKINGELREKVKELDTKNDELLKDLYSANCIIADLTDSIPKQVVIDKINENSNIEKEIEEKIKEEENSGDICREYIRDLKRQKGLVKRDILTLQELLEGEK